MLELARAGSCALSSSADGTLSGSRSTLVVHRCTGVLVQKLLESELTPGVVLFHVALEGLLA